MDYNKWPSLEMDQLGRLTFTSSLNCFIILLVVLVLNTNKIIVI